MRQSSLVLFRSLCSLNIYLANPAVILFQGPPIYCHTPQDLPNPVSVAGSANAKFTPIVGLSISFQTLCCSSGRFGSIIGGHLGRTSSVANTKAIANPCLISMLSRASIITLCHVRINRPVIYATYIFPPFDSQSSPVKPARSRSGRRIS